MAYNHQQTAEAVQKCLLKEPRISLRAMSDRLGIERHTIRRVLISELGLTFRDLQRECVLKRAIELHADREAHSGKEMSFAVGYRSAASLARLIKRSRQGSLP